MEEAYNVMIKEKMRAKVQQLQRICNKFIRLVFGSKRRDSVRTVMKESGLLTIKQLYKAELAIFKHIKLLKRTI